MNSLKVLAICVFAAAMLGAASSSQDAVSQGAVVDETAAVVDAVTSVPELPASVAALESRSGRSRRRRGRGIDGLQCRVEMGVLQGPGRLLHD